MSPSMLNNPSLNEINRLRDEIVSQNAKQMQWEDRIMQASKACQAWKSEADESNRKVKNHVIISNSRIPSTLCFVRLAVCVKYWQFGGEHGCTHVQRNTQNWLKTIEIELKPLIPTPQHLNALHITQPHFSIRHFFSTSVPTVTFWSYNVGNSGFNSFLNVFDHIGTITHAWAVLTSSSF